MSCFVTQLLINFASLDSTAAFECITVLKKLACDANVAVVCSIHQPSNDVFRLFSYVYLLSKNGRNMYFGSPSKLFDVLCNNDIKLKRNKSIAQLAIDVATKYDTIKLDSLDTVLPMDENNNVLGFTYDLQVVNKCRDQGKLPMVQQVRLIAQRTFVLWNLKTPQLFAVKLFLNVVMAFLATEVVGQAALQETSCLDFEHTNLTTQEMRNTFTRKNSNIFNAMAMIIGTLVHLIVVNQSTYSIAWAMELPAVRSELANRWYTPMAYFIARILGEIPGFLFHNCCLFIPVYFLAAFPTTLLRMSVFLGSLLLTAAVAEAWGSLFGLILEKDLMPGLACNSLLTFLSMITSGYFVRGSDMAWFWKPLYWTSYARYGTEGLMISLYGFDRCPPSNSTTDIFTEAALSNTPIRVISDIAKQENISRAEVDRIFNLIQVNRDQIDTVYNASVEYIRQLESSLTTDTRISGQSSSFVMNKFELTDNDVFKCYAMLLLIFTVLKLITYIIFKHKFK